MGGGFWDAMREFVRRTMVDQATIDASDLDLARPAATPEEALQIVQAGS